MNLCAQCDELLVPGSDDFRRLLNAHLKFGGILQETILLFDDAIVIGQRLHVSVMKRDDAAIYKLASRFRHPAHDVKFVCGESDRRELSKVARDCFTFAVDGD